MPEQQTNTTSLFTDPFVVLGTQTTILEIFAVLCGLSSVWFMKKENILVYPLGIINVVIYVYICYTSRLYAYAGINVFYAAMSMYGWYNWLRKNQEDERIKIARLTIREYLVYTILIIGFFFLLRYLLQQFTDSVIPSWDALTTAIYIIAMWLLAQKKIEHWILWIVGDVISIGMFAWLNLYFSSFQFLAFTVIAVFGFIEWRGKLTNTPQPPEGGVSPLQGI
ncbi:MAG: nicotinamide mononucleotide transporter [Bacteroidales bacterium]|nr:nicotinamide mononucleotide transporter [Bacteroidales bacterium]